MNAKIGETLANKLHAIWRLCSINQTFNIDLFSKRFQLWIHEYLMTELKDPNVVSSLEERYKERAKQAFEELKREYLRILPVSKHKAVLEQFMKWPTRINEANKMRSNGLARFFARVGQILKTTVTFGLLRSSKDPNSPLAEHFTALVEEVGKSIDVERDKRAVVEQGWQDRSVKVVEEKNSVEDKRRLDRRVTLLSALYTKVAQRLSRAKRVHAISTARIEDLSKGLSVLEREKKSLENRLERARANVDIAKRENRGVMSWIRTPVAVEAAQKELKSAEEVAQKLPFLDEKIAKVLELRSVAEDWQKHAQRDVTQGETQLIRVGERLYLARQQQYNARRSKFVNAGLSAIRANEAGRRAVG
jgi:hypothetical protein